MNFTNQFYIEMCSISPIYPLNDVGSEVVERFVRKKALFSGALLAHVVVKARVLSVHKRTPCSSPAKSPCIVAAGFRSLPGVLPTRAFRVVAERTVVPLKILPMMSQLYSKASRWHLSLGVTKTTRWNEWTVQGHRDNVLNVRETHLFNTGSHDAVETVLFFEQLIASGTYITAVAK